MLDQPVLVQIDAVVDCAQPRHGFLLTLRLTDANVINLGLEAVNFAESRITWTMQCQTTGCLTNRDSVAA
jgi:hypothetical protein